MIRKNYDTDLGGGGNFTFGEWQLCPKCNGEGILYGVIQNHDTTAITVNPTCHICNGSKLIQRPLTSTTPSISNTVTNTEEK